MPRLILHVDLDAFYAQVEELRHPELKGKPVVVCMFSARGGDSGAVATASYEARKLGVTSGMPIAFAKRKAPEAAYLPADRDHYTQVSNRIMALLARHADAFEQVSIDEAYLDVSASCGSVAKATALARAIKRDIRKQERLTCSVGVGPNKLVAKIAAGMKKPDGLLTVTGKEAERFLAPLPVGTLFGVGPKTEAELADLGVQTVSDLKKLGLAQLQKLFGPAKAKLLHDAARGQDERPVKEREKKQLGRVTTLKQDSRSRAEIGPVVDELLGLLQEKVRQQGVSFRTVTVFFVSNEMEHVSRSQSVPEASKDVLRLKSQVLRLVEDFLKERRDFMVRRIGISVSGFAQEPETRKVQRTLAAFEK